MYIYTHMMSRAVPEDLGGQHESDVHAPNQLFGK